MSLQEIVATWEPWWSPIGGTLLFVLHAVAAGHAIVTKREVRAAIGWVGVIVISPVLGPLLYGLLGINRIPRRAAAIRRDRGPGLDLVDSVAHTVDVPDASPAHLVQLSRLVDGVTHVPLLRGNRVTPHFTGDAAYGAMLAAIGAAERSIAFATYIFDVDRAGKRFIAALSDARRRGVEVRVLIDDAGARYSFPRARGLLRSEGVRAVHFMPALSPFRAPFVNLRNHRKLLVVDGELGFTGGMNIRAGHLQSAGGDGAIRDVHFTVAGPLVGQLQRVFAEDWWFSARERLDGEEWFPPLQALGETTGRGIADGPDGHFETLVWTLLGAIGCARESIRVMTPYFLPDQRVLTALDVAAMRGVTVDIVVPEHSNLPIVQWAMWAQFDQLVERGCRLWLSPGAFDHSKLVVVDDHWTLVGSANWDARSLRLNFEFCIECYDSVLARQLTEHFERKRKAARALDAQTLSQRGLPRRLRDGVARLFAPYL